MSLYVIAFLLGAAVVCYRVMTTSVEFMQVLLHEGKFADSWY